jgi:hypothetical protein
MVDMDTTPPEFADRTNPETRTADRKNISTPRAGAQGFRSGGEPANRKTRKPVGKTNVFHAPKIRRFILRQAEETIQTNTTRCLGGQCGSPDVPVPGRFGSSVRADIPPPGHSRRGFGFVLFPGIVFQDEVGE